MSRAKIVTISFNVQYWTQWGENLAVIGTLPQLGDWNPLAAKRMAYQGNGNWNLELKLNVNEHKSLEYRYVVIRSDKSFLWEAGAKRELNVADLAVSSVQLNDIWKSPFSTEELLPHMKASIFSQVIFGRGKESKSENDGKDHLKFGKVNPAASSESVAVHFRITSVWVPAGHSLRIVGAAGAVGSWKLESGAVMSDAKFPVWEAEVSVLKSQIPFQYKLVMCNDKGGEAIWEEGENRVFSATAAANFVELSKFRRFYEFKGAGVAVPVFSLRSNKSLGVGEFADLKLLVDWAVQSGLKIVQILPVNDTWSRNDWRDSYPYSAISVFALHPLYLHLPAITKDAAILKEVAAKAATLNALDQVDYEAVLFYKRDVARKVFESQRKEFLNSKEFKEWFGQNEHWLVPYALFSAFRDQYETADYSNWAGYEHPSPDEVAKLAAPESKFYDAICVYYFMQYHLHVQLQEAAQYAAAHRVGFKGDIAIGVNPKSVETWTQPHLFRMDKSTGAPPDAFSTDGQNWGFPTYNWDEMAKDDYFWWKQRLTHMAQYFHAFRIDHILGFFRIWEIPGNQVTGLLGRFQPSIPVRKSELQALGFWDFERLTEPYVRQHLLERYLGNDWDTINKFFNYVSPGVYKFKPEYSNEKAIAAALPTVASATVPKEKAEENARKKAVLFNLVQNVVFLTDSEDSNNLYPRIECTKTTSYAELESWQREVIKQVYIDYFYKRQDGLWSSTALQRLPVMINSTKMLCCGEDLGMVPDCVPPVMNQLNILGLRIQRMASDPKVEFMHPSDYGYLIVCTPSVHDTSTLRGWWEEDRASSQRFWNQILGEQGPAPYYCDESVTLKVFNQHIYSRSMWTVFALQDFFALNKKYFENRNPATERINEPSNPEHYWRYRMHIKLEDLLADKSFSDRIKSMLQYSGR